MRVALYTYDLFPGRERLMPWRTILEVAKVMLSQGLEAFIINACNDNSMKKTYHWQGVNIEAIDTGYIALASFIRKKNVNVVYIPFTWRDGLKDLSPLYTLPCQKIAYLAGGVYDFRSANLLRKLSSLSLAKPYLIESLLPKRILSRALTNAKFSHCIGLTNLSAQEAQKVQIPGSLHIYPGKDPFELIEPDFSILDKYGLRQSKWFLFSGAPAPTRGAELLLQAIDVAKNDLKVVMLMRTDIGSVYDKFNYALSRMRNPHRVQIIRESVTKEQLRAFFGSAWYALLPFVVIPSEIPLTYFELMSCGTPIVSFHNGGTTDYLNEGLVLAKKSKLGLASAMDIVWNNENLRREKSNNGLQLMKQHPSWSEVGYSWISLID